MAVLGQSTVGQVHSWAQHGAVTQSPRADSCLMPVCPWCILRAVHGDEQSAIRQAEQASACVASGPARGHGHYIVAHALKWCKELCRREPEQAGPPAWQPEQSGSAWLHAGWLQTHTGPETSFVQWMNQVVPASPPSSSSTWRPHIPAPCIPPPGLVRASAWTKPIAHATGQAPPPAPPLPAQPTLTF